jgi:hypothetical protein
MMTLLSTLVVLGPFAASAQSLPPRKEAAILLQKAAEAADLRAAHDPPFHLVVNIHYEIGRQSLEGTYELLWASPDRYRANFRMNPATEIEIASGDKLYTLRNTPTLVLPLWTVRNMLNSLQNYFYGPHLMIDKIYSAQANGEKQICIDSGDESTKRQACFEGSTNQALFLGVAAEFSHSAYHDEKKLFGMELNDFFSLGHKRYPRQIVRHQYDEKAQVEVKVLEQVTAFDKDVFAPPDGSEVRDWCPNPDTKGKATHGSAPTFNMHSPGSLYAYYVIVGNDGHVKKAAAMRSIESSMDERMKEWLQTWKFPVILCNGKPIEQEAVVEVPIRIPISF